jgi:maleate isomerase
MSGSAAGYGSCGRIGIGTPQANPTVEAEMAILLPRTCTQHVVRLTSPAAEPAARLVDYIEGLPGYLARYDSFRPDVFGFACTGSAYLVGAAREAEIVAGVAMPVVTATAAIRWALGRLGAQRIAVVAPYPGALFEAGLRYWAAAGFEIMRAAQVKIASPDTRNIYALASDDARPVLEALDLSGLDAVLLSGTGLPSLPLLADWPQGVPLLSSNACLAACLMARMGREDALDAAGWVRGWQGRLADALGV